MLDHDYRLNTYINNYFSLLKVLYRYRCGLRSCVGGLMGPTWFLSAPDGPHIGPMNFAIREVCLGGIGNMLYCDYDDHLVIAVYILTIFYMHGHTTLQCGIWCAGCFQYLDKSLNSTEKYLPVKDKNRTVLGCQLFLHITKEGYVYITNINGQWIVEYYHPPKHCVTGAVLALVIELRSMRQNPPWINTDQYPFRKFSMMR